jgi:L-alanine-DL-glutamate epimerase-like enolase superfamily enzyme
VTPAALAEALAALPVIVERVDCRTGLLPLEGYGGEGRPSSFVELHGLGQIGFGELVSFGEPEHLAFRQRAAGLLRAQSGRVGELGGGGEPHERAALESALIDLALRQAGRGLGDLCGRDRASLRWAASFAALAEPGPALPPRTELKLDVHPGWSESVVRDLAARAVVILDWKGQGSPEQARRLSAAFPGAIFEDPPDGSSHARIARDRPLGSARDVRDALGRGELVNLKGPRMGGFLELLRGLEAAAGKPGWAYFGGMFEVGPGREQARQLAALFCAGAPNDLAPFAGGSSSLEGPSPSEIRLDRPGFGSNLDWSGGPIRSA